MSLFGEYFSDEITLEAAEGYGCETDGLGLLLESVDDDLDIIKAMHAYEIKRIQMEATGVPNPDEQDIEDADEVEDVLEAAVKDVFETIKTAVKNFFSKLLGYLKSVIDFVVNNAKRFEAAAKSLRKKLNGKTACDVTPEGYEVYTWGNCDGANLEGIVKEETEAEKAARADFSVFINNGAEIIKDPARATRHELIGKDVEGGEAFATAVKEALRGAKVENIKDCGPYLEYLEKGYGEFVKAYKVAQKKVNDDYKQLIKSVNDAQKAAKKAEGKDSEMVKAAKEQVAAMKAAKSVKLTYMNIVKSESIARANASLKICNAAAKGAKGSKEDDKKDDKKED